MVDYNKAVGNAGTMIIRDNGTTVEYLIKCTDGATFVGGYTWSGVVNGAAVGGTVSLPAGFGTRSLGVWTVSTTQTVTFHQNATGTSGLGGAADHSAAINRGPAATVPGPPIIQSFEATGPTSLHLQFTFPASDGGSPINLFRVHFQSPPGNDLEVRETTTGTHDFTGLEPGREYRAVVFAHNAVGWGPESDAFATTFTGVQVSDGSAWHAWVADVSDGSTWIRQRVDVSDGSTWLPAG